MTTTAALLFLVFFFAVLSISMRIAMVVMFDRRHWYIYFLSGDSGTRAFKDIVAAAERSDSKVAPAILLTRKAANALFVLLFCLLILQLLYANLA